MSNLRVINGIEKDYMPGYGADTNGSANITVDTQGCIRTRGTVMTDEGGYTTNYSSSGLVIGTCVFTNNSDIVTGSGFSNYDICTGDFVKYSEDDINKYVSIDSYTDTELILSHPYSGTSASGIGISAIEKPVIGVGGTLTYTNGSVVINAGTTNDSICELERDVDIIPLIIEKEINISQRINNQTIYLGAYSEDNPSRYWAWFQFSGTSDLNVITETAYSRGGAPTQYDKETNAIVIPNYANTGMALRYRIELNSDCIRFLINDTIVATHKRVLMRPSAFLTSTLRVMNGTGPASDTNITCNWSRSYNYNKLSVGFLDKDSALFSPDIPKDNDSCIPVRIAPQKVWKCTFAKRYLSAPYIDTDFFTIKQTGSGQTITQNNGNLIITAGTIANAETVIRSNRTWTTDSFCLRFLNLLSGRIANNNFIIELTDIIGDGLTYNITNATTVVITVPNHKFTNVNIGQGMNIHSITGAAGVSQRCIIASISGNNITFTVASWPATGTGTCSLTGWNNYRMAYNGISVTAMLFDTQRMGWNLSDTTCTINTTAATQMTQLFVDDSTVVISDSVVSSTAVTGLQFTQRATRCVNIPDSAVPLYIQIRALNGTSAPASSTTWTIGTISIEEFASTPVTVQHNKQIGYGSNTVYVAAGSVSASSTPVASTAMIGDVNLGIRATNTNSLVLNTNNKHIISVSGTNATAVKASAGRLYGIIASNTTASMKFIKFYQSATAPSSGSSLFTIGVPANNTLEWHNNIGIYFATGIACAMSNSMADAWDATGIGANEVLAEILVG